MKQEIIKFNFKFKNNDFYILSNKNELAYKMIKKWPEWPTQLFIFMDLKSVVNRWCKLWKTYHRYI